MITRLGETAQVRIHICQIILGVRVSKNKNLQDLSRICRPENSISHNNSVSSSTCEFDELLAVFHLFSWV